jgi:hypothetical protein
MLFTPTVLCPITLWIPWTYISLYFYIIYWGTCLSRKVVRGLCHLPDFIILIIIITFWLYFVLGHLVLIIPQRMTVLESSSSLVDGLAL